MKWNPSALSDDGTWLALGATALLTAGAAVVGRQGSGAVDPGTLSIFVVDADAPIDDFYSYTFTVVAQSKDQALELVRKRLTTNGKPAHDYEIHASLIDRLSAFAKPQILSSVTR